MITKTVASFRAAAAAAAAGRYRTSRRRSSSGFTLAEILAVVVILGIASAIIIPQIGTRDDMRVKAAARTLIADLIYAQNLAISTGQTVYVRFDTAGNKYSLLTNPANAKAKKGDPVQHPITQSDYVTAFGSTHHGWEQVSIKSAVMNGVDVNFRPEFTVGFDEIGSPQVWCYDLDQKNDLNDGTIILKAGQFTNTITITPATGEILVN
jgi:prepilin-type N-terminal cleavage/methylation domain-containing protein